KNTVPDRAEAQADIRYIKRADGEALTQRLRDAAEQAGAAVPGTRLELSGGVGREPLERTPGNVALMEAYAAAARASGLAAGEAPLIAGGSVASTSAAMGIASIDGLGPRGKGFHTIDEHIEVETLVPKAEALARFLVSRRAPHGG
ncbi:MAG TPA: M20 family peptidase, partial [Myxococcaceae bacterium]|nr:M20 family peptidase [Myxococcaceae bacterium]